MSDPKSEEELAERFDAVEDLESLGFDVSNPQVDELNSSRVLLSIETAKGSLILLDPAASKDPTFSNLLFVEHGSIKWRAELPQSHDAFVEIRLIDTREIEAKSWCGFIVQIDLETGRIVKKEFVK
jgi:hypothetical protein